MTRRWIALLALAACSNESSSPTDPPAPPIVTQTIGTTGGTVDVPGHDVTLDIPAGALAGDTDVTVRIASSGPSGAIGDVLDFGPDGQTFTVPVVATFRLDPDELPALTLVDDLVIQTREGGGWTGVPARVVDRGDDIEIRAYLTHFSPYAVVTVAETSTLYGTFGFAADDVYGYGAGGVLAHFDGATVTARDSGLGSSARLFDGWGTDRASHHCAGWDGDGRIWREQGGAWVPEPIPPGSGPASNQPLVSICGDGSAIVAVGHGGRIVTGDGLSWADESYTTPGGPDGVVRRFRTVAARGDGTFLLGGDDIVLVGAPGAWTEVDLSTLFGTDPFSIQGIWARSATELFAVGSTLNVGAARNEAFALTGDGTSWSRDALPSGLTDLRSVWGDGDERYAVGANGSLLEDDGSGWIAGEFCETTNRTLFDVWAVDAEFAAAVGGGGVFLYAGVECDPSGGPGGTADETFDFDEVPASSCSESWIEGSVSFDVVDDVVGCTTCAVSTSAAGLRVTSGRFRGIGSAFTRVEIDVEVLSGSVTAIAYAGGYTLDIDGLGGPGRGTLVVEVASGSFYIFSVEGCDFRIEAVRVHNLDP